MGSEPPIGMLMLVCAKTGGEINSGVVYHREDLVRAKAAKLLLRCRYCGETHLFKFSDARLNPIQPGKQ